MSTATGVPTPARSSAPPSTHRRALITWLAVYPTITLALALLGPVTAGLPLPVRTLILTVLVVPVVVYVLMPALLRLNTAVTRRHRAAQNSTPAAGPRHAA